MPDLIPFPVHEADADIRNAMDGAGEDYLLTAAVGLVDEGDHKGLLRVVFRIGDLRGLTDEHMISLVRIMQKYGLNAEIAPDRNPDHSIKLKVTLLKIVATVTGGQ